MLGPLASSASPLALGFATMLAQHAPPAATTSTTTANVPLAPAVLMALCVVAGVGTVMLLPSRREAPLRKMGGMIVAAAGLILAALLIRWTGGSPNGGMGIYFWKFSALAGLGGPRGITPPKPLQSALPPRAYPFARAR